MQITRAALAAILLLTPSSGLAILHIDLGDCEEHTWLVNYKFVDSKEGNESMEVLPYDFPMEILKVETDKEGKSLDYSPINEDKEGKSKFLVEYPEPTGPGGKSSFRLEARMTDPNSYFEDTAKLTFLYQTAHRVYVSLPKGYFPIFTDEPMEIKQEKERVVLSSEGGRRRPIVIFAVRCGE